MKTILIGISGGIAACKTPELIIRLKKAHINPIVILTKSASSIISENELHKASGNRVYTKLFTPNFNYKNVLKNRTVDHISLAHHASLFVIAPATANIIAKLAHGIADDFLTTTALAVQCPVLVCPSMNTTMWNHPATQQNISTLRSYGYIILEPENGTLACGDEGKGRLPPVQDVEKEIVKLVHSTNDLKGKTVIVTTGGTSEKIDDVRFITNKSSGKMGIAIAEHCLFRGANVILLRSKTSVIPRYPLNETLFDTADELEKLLHMHLSTADVCFHVAAVSDFTITNTHNGKSSSIKPLPLELTPRSKILDKIKSINPKLFLVAFKAEWNVSDKELIKLSKKRLRKANANLIVANDVGRNNQGFGSNTNEVFIIESNDTVTHVPLCSKQVIAKTVVDTVILNLQ